MSNASPNTLVFVAYARGDVARVEPIVAALRAHGFNVHFDAASAHGSGSYVHESQRALLEANALVVFVSQAAAQSPWVEAEARAFQSQLARGGGRKLIPVRLDEIAMPLALAHYTAVDAVGAAPAMVAATLAHYLSAQPEAPAAAPIDREAAMRERMEAEAAERERRWEIVKQAREREAAEQARREAEAAAAAEPVAAAPEAEPAEEPAAEAEPVEEPAAPAEPMEEPAAPAEPTAAEAAPAGDQLVWDGDQWVWGSEGMASRGVSEPLPPAAPPEPSPEAQPDTVKAPAVGSEHDLDPIIGIFDSVDTERGIHGADAEPAPGVRGGEPVAQPAPVADESEFGGVRGGWQEPPEAEVAPPPEPAAPPPPPPPQVAPPRPQPITQPRVEAVPAAPPPAPGSVAPITGGPAPAAQPSRLEQVTFTAYHPREMQPQLWQPLVVYISLNNPATLALVSAAAAERLAGSLEQFRPGRADKPAGLARGTALRIVPAMPGFEFNPAYLDVTWQEDVQQHEFRMRATTAQPGRAANGVVQFYQGLLLRAEVPMSVFVGQAAARLDSPDAYAQAIARAYRRVFASYSHRDMPVVESCETAARTMGDQYLRDVTLLQAGTQWDPRLIQAINEADVFQLFWSKRAASSPYVEREWRHALELLPARPNFIRPVYWSHQLHPTPKELNGLHFQPLSLTSLGWGWLRRTLYEMGAG